MKKYSILLSGIIAFSFSSVQPISMQTAYGLTAGAGIGTFAVASMLSKNYVVGLLCTAPVSVLTYFITMSFTAEGRYKSALQKTTHVAQSKFAEHSYDSDQLFINELQDEFRDQFWLISAHDEFDSLLKEGYHALELLMLVKQEAHENYELIEKANNLQQKLRTLMANLTNALRRIKNHIDFSAQRTSYNQLLIEKQRLAIEREKAHAQQTQAQAQVMQAQAQNNQANAMWHAANKR